MAVREDKLGQSWLFPLCIGDFVPGDYICNLVVAVCGELHKYSRDRGEVPGSTWQSCVSTSRRVLLRLLVQAAIDGVWASRKIDKLAHENVIYMYLTRSEKPDFRTKAEEELNTAKLF